MQSDDFMANNTTAPFIITSEYLSSLLRAAFQAGKTNVSETTFLSMINSHIKKKSTNGQPVALQQDASLPAGGVKI